MTVHDLTMTKIRRLPESLAEEVSDLEDYENRLARGEIQW